MTLKELRAENGITQRELAKVAGVEGATITMIETGKSKPSLPVANKIAFYFGVPIEDIDDFKNEYHPGINRSTMKDFRKVKVGEKIKEAREAMGLTQQDLADLIEVNRSAIAGYETGLSFPQVSTLINISRELEVTLDELFSGFSYHEKCTKTKPQKESENQEENLIDETVDLLAKDLLHLKKEVAVIKHFLNQPKEKNSNKLDLLKTLIDLLS